MSVIMLVLTLPLSGCFFEDGFTKALPAQKIELSKYLGSWYEIARIPNWFEKELVGVTATYSLKENGEIKVLNQGYKNILDGEKKVAEGRAWVPDKDQPGRLKVSFFWLVAADYIVLEIGPNYEFALVGSGKDYLWVLSRTPQLDESNYQSLIAKAAQLGYDTSRLEKVTQPGL